VQFCVNVVVDGWMEDLDGDDKWGGCLLLG
jgi:hypothetical protein